MSPNFELGASSCFADFIQQASEKFGRILATLQSMSSDGKINNSFLELFKSDDYNLQSPLLSKLPLMSIFCKLEDAKKECREDDMDLISFENSVKELIQFLSRHEIHILLGGLRNADQPDVFIFNICEQSYEEWIDFASDSTLFGSVLKATWLRYEEVDDTSFDSINILQAELKKISPCGGIHDFTNHFQSVHFAPVYLLLSKMCVPKILFYIFLLFLGVLQWSRAFEFLKIGLCFA